MAGLFFMFLLLAFPSMYLFQYGTLGFLFVIVGALCRFKQDIGVELPKTLKRQIAFFSSASFFSYAIFQMVPMKVLTEVQFFTLSGCLLFLYFVFQKFKPCEFSMFNKSFGLIVKVPFQIFGRYTLEIYVLHLVLFKMLALYMYPETYQFMQWRWIHDSVMDFLITTL